MKIYKVKNLFDGKEMRTDCAFAIENEKFLWVGNINEMPYEDNEIIDLGDKSVIPGLIDCHVHVFPSEKEGNIACMDAMNAELTVKALDNLQDLLRSGVVACRDLGALNSLSIGIEKAQKNGSLKYYPKLIACGRSLSATGGHGWEMSLECDGVDEFSKGTRQVIKDGASVVKIMATGGVNSPGEEQGPPELTRDEISAVVREAHKRGKKVAVHTHGATAIKDCTECGVDSIEHGVFMDEETMDTMKSLGTFLVPTLSAPYHATIEGIKQEPDNPDHQKSKAVIAQHNSMLRKCVEKGVKVAMGTDAGAPFDPYFGSCYELILMSKAGIDNLDVLRIATSNGAELLNLDNLGYIEKGKEASFVVVDGSILEEMNNINKNREVYLKGKKVY
ncbi:MAG: amidohydrolase family protein [Sphaerochaetaceae bacterium]|nr:amidohydrolase family protein [Sphaerochaetaceae bacterium]